MIAAGRSENLPPTENNSDKGRSLNRGTGIVIIPQLDQFVKLMGPKN
ncbi:MAG: hypothetical protein H7321_08225 [Bacteroidia bacterium]|nr:hypothetical protein [Bacteroidia bacterium]